MDRIRISSLASSGSPGDCRGGVVVWVIAVVSLVVIGLAGAGIYVARNYEALIAKGITKAITSTVSASGLPQEEKAGIIDIVQQLKQGYLAGEITLQELQSILKSVGTSPVLTIGIIAQFEASYVLPSALGQDEKHKAKLDLNRFAQGLCAKRIGWPKTGEVTNPISVRELSGERRLKAPGDCSPDEIRSVLSLIRDCCDRAQIPNSLVVIDISEEFKKGVEEALGRKIA